MGFLDQLEFIPDEAQLQSLLTVLAAHITGPYRFVHSWVPSYVRVGVSEPGASITIHEGTDLTLLEGSTKVLAGAQTVDFKRWRAGPMLREVFWPMAHLNALMAPGPQALPRPARPRSRRLLATVPASSIPAPREVWPDVGPTLAAPPTPAPPPAPVVPPAPALAPVKTLNLSIPEPWRAFCLEHDLHPELRDYVVIPKAQVDAYPPLPDWVGVTEYVTEAQVVKPRMLTHRRVEGA